MSNLFRFCPNCRSEDTSFYNDNKFKCNACYFTYFHNVATAVAAIIINKGKILFTIRNNEPMLGKLDLPGGFVDPKETAEESIKRELKEELNLEVTNFKFFTTEHNTYLYKKILYRTCDVCYITEISNTHFKIDNKEIKEVKWLNPEEINLEEIGFESLKKIVKKFLNQL